MFSESCGIAKENNAVNALPLICTTFLWMCKGTTLNPINSLTTPWSLMVFFLYWLKWPTACMFYHFFSPPFPHHFLWLSSSVLLQNPSTPCFGEAQKHFFHKHDWAQSLKSHWDQGEISVSVWVQTFRILFGSMKHSGFQGRCQLCDFSWLVATRKKCSAPVAWEVFASLYCTICKIWKRKQKNHWTIWTLSSPLGVSLSLKSICFHNYVKQLYAMVNMCKTRSTNSLLSQVKWKPKSHLKFPHFLESNPDRESGIKIPLYPVTLLVILQPFFFWASNRE